MQCLLTQRQPPTSVPNTRAPNVNDRIRNRILWGITLFFGVFTFLKATPIVENLPSLRPIITIITPTLFAFLHGTRRLGWTQMVAFFVIACVVSWHLESLSISSGFPFGHYHYTDNLGPKLGTVPLLIMPAYFSMCYISWNLAHVVLDKFNAQADRLQLFAVPLVASFIMVMWDMCMDPSRATASQAWIWRDGGSYFGVPFSNFMGWFLCVYLIFQIFAFFPQRRQPAAGEIDNGDTRRENWHLNTAFYFATFLEFVAFAWLGTDRTLTDGGGGVWSARAMYETQGLVAIFTMGFVSCLAFIKVQNSARLQ